MLRDPLVVGLIAIACLAALETANLVLCVWAGVNSAFRKNLRHVSPTSDSRQATSKGGWSAVPRILALNFITLSSAFQIATVAYLLLIDWRFPNLHKPATFGQHHHQGTASLTISKLKTKRPITTILHDHQPHQLALEEAMEIYRDYQVCWTSLRQFFSVFIASQITGEKDTDYVLLYLSPGLFFDTFPPSQHK